MIVSKEDFPVYDVMVNTLVKSNQYGNQNAQQNMGGNSQLFEFILNAAMDPVEIFQWKNNNMYLKNVDKYKELTVHCLITPSNAKFLLLHEGRSED